MDLQRAKEIVQSAEKVGVELNGSAVWIDSIDAEQQTAKVHLEGNPAVEQTVSVEQLQEA